MIFLHSVSVENVNAVSILLIDEEIGITVDLLLIQLVIIQFIYLPNFIQEKMMKIIYSPRRGEKMMNQIA